MAYFRNEVNDRDIIPDTEWLLVLLVVRRPREETIMSKPDTLHVFRSSLLSESTVRLKEYPEIALRIWNGVVSCYPSSFIAQW